MASSSRKWARTISAIASALYFMVILFQIPLFRMPCRIGICKSPIEVTTSILLASRLIPVAAVKAVLYPGALARNFLSHERLPSFDSLPKLYNFTHVKTALSFSDIQHLEVLIGSYLSVAGAVAGLIRQGRMSLFGTLLLLWGLAKEVILGKSAQTSPLKAFQIYPTMALAVLFAILSIRRDVRKMLRSRRAYRVAKASWKAR